jgi:hypothetical protein
MKTHSRLALLQHRNRHCHLPVEFHPTHNILPLPETAGPQRCHELRTLPRVFSLMAKKNFAGSHDENSRLNMYLP